MVVLWIIAVLFIMMRIIAAVIKPVTIYNNTPSQKNPMEGKRVQFIHDPIEQANADGECGHLVGIGDTVIQTNFYERIIKRGLDVLLSFFGILVLFPVFLILCVCIYIDDPGPVLFIQKRIGRNKQYFSMHKFRSMKMSTPHDVPTHMLQSPEQCITKVGQFLRKHSLDELPQIWDIFIGNMAIIGPRPALWNQDVLIAERDKCGANEVKPGLTGWAQINGRDELEISVKAKLDGDYAKKLKKGGIEAFFFDCRCFLGTILSVLHKDGVIEGGTGAMKSGEANNNTKRSINVNTRTIAVLSSHAPSLFWFRMDMMKDFMARGWNVVAIANEDEAVWGTRFKEKGMVYRQIYVQRNGMNPLSDLKTLNSIRKVLREIKPEKVFCFQAKTVIYGAIAAYMQGITEVYPLIAGMGSVFLNDNLKTRMVREIVTMEYKLALRKCPVVFFQNHDDESIFRKNRIVTKQHVVFLHGSGVSTTRFEVKPLPSNIVFLCISRLIRDKGVGEYLEASRMLKKKYPEVRCLLVGPYDTNPSAIKQENLQPYIEDGSIEFFGETDEVRTYYYQSSVFVLPSYREGTPKTNLEAMASGRPVITTNTAGCKETVVDGENGFLVPVKDIKALYDKMIWFVEHPDSIEEMGLKGRKMVEEIFDVKKVDETICAAMKI